MKEFTQNKRQIKCLSNMTDVTKGSDFKKKTHWKMKRFIIILISFQIPDDEACWQDTFEQR